MKKKIVVNMIGTIMGLALLCGCGGSSPAAEPADRSAATEASVQEQEIKETETEEAAKGSETEPEAETGSKVTVITAASSNAAPVSDAEYETAYQPVFQETLDLLENGIDYDREYQFMSDGLMETLMYPGDEDLYEYLGYVLKDISGDGIPELIIGYNDAFSEDGRKFSYVLSICTLKNGEPFVTLNGWARNRYWPMAGGHFYNSGSSGAMNTEFGDLHLSEDGTEIIYDDYYFSAEDMVVGGLAFFHNTTGIWDTEAAERLQISEDQFLKLMDDYESKCELYSWTPMGSMKGRFPAAGKSSDVKANAIVPETVEPFYGVWLNASEERSDAQEIVAKLKDKGLEAYFVFSPEWANLSKNQYFCVTLGRSGSEAEAKELVKDAKDAGYKDAYVKYTGDRLGYRVNYTLFGMNEVDYSADKVVIKDVMTTYLADELTGNMDLVIDKDTVFDETCDMEYFSHYKEGDSVLDWFNRNHELQETDPDEYMSNGPALLGVFDVSLTGNHVDRFYGIYWWD